MAVKLPPIKRSTVIMLLNLLLGILTGNALPPMPLIGGELDPSEPETPVCPQTVVLPAARQMAPVASPVEAPPSGIGGIGGNSAVEPAGGAAPLVK